MKNLTVSLLDEGIIFKEELIDFIDEFCEIKQNIFFNQLTPNNILVTHQISPMKGSVLG
jgi:hypothetical protein